jgi:pSer/pThr/pTyr-binding forkhead associated (FHA) protein
MPTLVYNGSRYPLKTGINLVGRDQTCDIFIPDPHISRKHISIDVVSDGSVTVLDLGSTNGVIINGDRVPSAILNPGDTFTLGQLTFNLED